MDAIYLIITFVFFLFMAGLVQICDGLRES